MLGGPLRHLSGQVRQIRCRRSPPGNICRVYHRDGVDAGILGPSTQHHFGNGGLGAGRGIYRQNDSHVAKHTPIRCR